MKKILFIIPLLLLQTGCQKYLDEKPNQSQALPKDNLDNLQYILNDTNTMNQQSASAGEIASDNFYIADGPWKTLSQSQATSANLYIWNPNVFNDNDRNDWTLTYKVIFNANLVLDALNDIEETSANRAQWENIKGEALFFRGYCFYQLLQEFSKAYDPATAAADPGVALRLTSDISIKSVRSSIADSYAQVIKDLQGAVPLLASTAPYKTLPAKAAALGLLARTFLSMSNYTQALDYARQYLAVTPGLLDYNKLSTTASFPFARYNAEVGFHATLYQWSAYSASYGRVADALYNSYDANDLRKTLFYSGAVGNISFKGSYDGSRTAFGGIANDELYLVAAECSVRTGDITGGLNFLNTLLANRWKSGKFVPYTSLGPADALKLILTERRKELVYRNLRWGDLKRLNLQSDFQTSISRTVNGQSYSLLPGDSRYVLPLPVKVSVLSGMQ